MFLAVCLVLFGALGLVYGVGHVLASHVDGTVLVDNPERPPETFCEGTVDPPGFDDDACDAPQQVERNVDRIIERAIGEIAGIVFVGMALVVVGLTLVVHTGSWLAGGSNGLGASFAVTVWGLTPIVLTVPVSLVALSIVLDPVTVSTASEPTSVFAKMEAQIRSFGWIGTVSSVVSGLWSAVIWKFGLEHRRDLTGAEATTVAGATALLLVLGGAI